MTRLLAAFFVVLMAAGAFAGCFGATDEDVPGEPAPQVPRDIPLHALDRMEAFSVITDDEITLRGHVYVPKGEGPFPIILNYAPYWNSIQGHSEEQASSDGVSMTGIFGTLMEAGFAVALVNVRGTGESDGCNSWMDFAVDGADAARVIQALADLPYSNGNVGMVGISWHGYSQYAALYEQPPALKAVAPASAVLDLWTLFTRRGPTINSQFGPMASTYAVFQGAIGVGIAGDVGQGRAECPEHADQVAAFNQLTIDGDKTAFFHERDAYEVLAENEIPLLVTNGMTSGEGHILQFDGLWELIQDEGRLIAGQWGHAYPDDEREAEYLKILVQWFDHYLRGGPQTITTGVVEYQDDEDGWHETDAWPPDSQPVRLYLSDGAIVESPEHVSASTQPFQSAYVDPRPDACPGNKAIYVSPPLANDVLLAGYFHSNVTVTATNSNGHFGLHLWHVDDVFACQESPDGLADGRQFEAGRAMSDLRHRGHLEQGSPFPVGAPDVMSMQSHPFASVVKAGERLVLGVSGGSDELAWRPEMPAIIVHTGGAAEAWIEVPVVEGRLVFAS